MVRWTIFVVVCLLAHLSVFAKSSHHLSSLERLTQSKVHRFETKARHDLYPSFVRAHINYPPKKLALLVFKKERTVELWAKNDNASEWAYVRDFPVLAASGSAGPKLHEGDYQVPEGIYHIVGLNPASHYDLSMKINYPNAFDRYHAKLDHRGHLGGDIFIHGSDVSIGCIALGNRAIEDLFVLSYKVGIDNIQVIIAPNDLRSKKPIVTRSHLRWIKELDAKIGKALKPFSLARKHVSKKSTRLV